MKSGHVIGLKSENVKRIVAVEIEPDPTAAVVRISGENGAGKSSLLDSIAYAIGGKKLIPACPIREGQKRGSIKVELDDYWVVRSFAKTESEGYSSSLKVTAKDGAQISNGQQVLDRLLGKLTFDPLEFAMADAKEQYKLLRSIVELPIDLASWQIQDDSLREQRTFAGRDLKNAQGALNSAQPFDKTAPREEINVVEASQELLKAQDVIQTHKDALRDLEVEEEGIQVSRGKIEKLDIQIGQAEKDLKNLKHMRASIADAIPIDEKRIANLKAKVGAEKLPDITALSARITEADGYNKRVRANKQYRDLQKKVEEAEKVHDELKDAIDAHADIKTQAFAAAKVPLKGLEFGEDVVIYQGVPLDQASDGEKIKISLAVAMALNPDLKVLLIRQGSLLSKKSQKIVEELASEKGYQVWMEIIEKGTAPAFVIEEGELKTDGEETK
jgi:DNA repair exonuclease SbcCD ATPase subunit